MRAKRIITVVLTLTVLLTLVLCSCGVIDVETSETEKTVDEIKNERFRGIVMSQHNGGSQFEAIYIDTETNVMYFFAKNGYGAGMCVMVDAEGKPLIYEGQYDG